MSGSSIDVCRPDPLAATVRPPGSKSLTNRALLIAAFARGSSRLVGCLDSEDTQLMRGCLRDLGVAIREEGDAIVVEGTAGALGRGFDGTVEVGTAGTAARFLTGMLAGSRAEARIVVDGSPRMRERPMGALIEGLRSMGGNLRCLGKEGYLPLEIRPTALEAHEVALDRPASSQFVSALVLAATTARAPVDIVLRQGTPARPYVDMTLAQLARFRGNARWRERDVVHVEPTMLEGTVEHIEPDASAASYFLALAAVHGGQVTIPGLGRSSLQGDAAFFTVLEALGAEAEQDDARTIVRGTGSLRGADLDLADMPDMTLTAAVVALFASGPTRIRGVSILRHHESDRIAAGAAELRKLGARVEEHEDGLTIDPPVGGPRHGARIETYLDHRMAMAFAVAGDVTILDPSCCAKTFPDYFEVLGSLGMIPQP